MHTRVGVYNEGAAKTTFTLKTMAWQTKRRTTLRQTLRELHSTWWGQNQAGQQQGRSSELGTGGQGLDCSMRWFLWAGEIWQGPDAVEREGEQHPCLPGLVNPGLSWQLMAPAPMGH